ncbi:hypothetical protein CERSUDRAFT_74769 [Gelatoporia subvermispora B]|uniref:Uncharacterized protein n=1 Tax=Ceriporiopsis subvermispora (strain B) TaxID=914234 RepID=M2PIK4_CERS8|nr:hypothetical protein CERSUDRAFT_74769 [Gelatoporia subvermispora B]
MDSDDEYNQSSASSESEDDADYHPPASVARKPAATASVPATKRAKQTKPGYKVSQFKRGLIDLDPEYQRKFPYPSFDRRIAGRHREDGHKIHSFKARQRSIRATGRKYYFRVDKGSRKYELPENIREEFLAKQFSFVEYWDVPTFTEDTEREIFQRVQNGVPLTGAERMRAFVGSWTTSVRALQSQYLDNDYGQHLPRAHTRNQDFENLARMVWLLTHHARTKSRELPKFPKNPPLTEWLQSKTPVPPELSARLHEIFRIPGVLVRDERYNRPLNKRIGAKELSMIDILIYLHRSSLSLEQLSSAIAQMRTKVANFRTKGDSDEKKGELMITFVTKTMRSSRYPVDASEERPALLVIREMFPDVVVAPSEPTEKMSKAQKRKRPEAVEGSQTLAAEVSPAASTTSRSKKRRLAKDADAPIRSAAGKEKCTVPATRSTQVPSNKSKSTTDQASPSIQPPQRPEASACPATSTQSANPPAASYKSTSTRWPMGRIPRYSSASQSQRALDATASRTPSISQQSLVSTVTAIPATLATSEGSTNSALQSAPADIHGASRAETRQSIYLDRLAPREIKQRLDGPSSQAVQADGASPSSIQGSQPSQGVPEPAGRSLRSATMP